MKCMPEPFSDIVDCVNNAYQCISGNVKDRRRKKRATGQTTDDLLPEYTRRYLSVLQYSRLGELILVDRRWFGANATDWWRTAVYPTLREVSDGGQYISVNEFNAAMSYPLPSNITSDMAATLLRRINDSFVSWDRGVASNNNDTINLDAFLEVAGVIYNDTKKAKQAGFNSTIAWFLDADEAMNEADTDTKEGVCAQVRIQILQKLVLTRSAFSARLEIENGETEQLTNIAVEIIVADHSTQVRANNLFSIGRPEVEGMSDIDGRGLLEVNVKGSAQWLIAPYSTAAPTEDTEYDIGGILYYTVNGENITVPLFPATVTVKPDPRLYVYYFLEKYIYSDDPLTAVVEPVVPFSLGILITNNGYGTANNLEITSAQPEIIENEKGLLVTITIIGTQIGNTVVSPSLTINFGDILPHTTKMARWIMTSTLAGVFSNYSATFQNVNPLGDPQLSVLDSLKFFELMHVIRVDFPNDDGLVDFLTISTTNLGVLPDQIYLSDNGTSPLNVSVGNVTSLTTISSNRIQLVVICSCTGWVYFRTEYQPSDLSLSTVLRSDGRSVRVGDNIWIGKIKKTTFLHLIDYIPASDTQYQYNIQLSKINTQASQFVDDVYYVNVTEDMDPTYLIDVSIDRRSDDLTVTYSIVDTTLPFSINPANGTLRTTAKLDRETQDMYSIVVIAVDDGSPPLTGTAIVVVNVIDVNDNSPVFGSIPTDIYVEDIISVGYVLLQITVTDKDAGLNGAVDLSLVDLSGLFKLDAVNSSLITKTALNQRTGSYNLTIRAQDEGVPLQKSEVEVTVHVVSKDLHQPQFSTLHYIFSVNETRNSYVFIGKLVATDADNPNENLTFSISHAFQSLESCALPFQVDSVSGVITNILELSSGPCSNYTFEVQVTDSGAPPTGPLTGKANVTVYIQDINDHAPEFPQSNYSVHIPENVIGETILLTIKATDEDFGANGAVVNYTLSQIYPSSPFLTKFRLTVIAGEAVIKAVQPLDRESQDRYLLQLIAVDGGQPPLSSNATTVEVLVDDVNDNSPEFVNITTATVTIPRNAPVNTVIYTVSATDADIGNNAIVHYMSVSSSQYINVQRDSGNVILANSLQGTNITSMNINISATDGQLNSNATFQLTVFISDRNIYPPRFDNHEYVISISELTPTGSSVLRLTATDRDSPILYYSIADGNDGNRFRVDALTGVLQVVGDVSNRSIPFYNLTVRVIDSATEGPDSLFDFANIKITITRANRYSPVFTAGPTIYVHVTEGATAPNLTQLNATDQDGDSIIYSLMNATESQYFSVDPYSGWLSVIVPLHRQPSTQYMIQVTATDNGVPPRQSTVDIIVVVDSASFVSTSIFPLNPSQGFTLRLNTAAFEITTASARNTSITTSSAVSKSIPQNATVTAGNGQRTATYPGGQQTVTAEGGLRTTNNPGGQQTVTAGDGLRTTANPGGQQTSTVGGGLRTTNNPGGQQTSTVGGGLRTTNNPGGQQTSTAGGGLRTTANTGGQQTVTAGGGQRTATNAGGQQTSTAGGGLRTTNNPGDQQTSTTGDGQRTTNNPYSQQATTEGIAVVVGVIVSVVVFVVVVILINIRLWS